MSPSPVILFDGCKGANADINQGDLKDISHVSCLFASLSLAFSRSLLVPQVLWNLPFYLILTTFLEAGIFIHGRAELIVVNEFW